MIFFLPPPVTSAAEKHQTTTIQFWQVIFRIAKELYHWSSFILETGELVLQLWKRSICHHWKELSNRISHEALTNVQLHCLDKTCDLFTHWRLVLQPWDQPVQQKSCTAVSLFKGYVRWCSVFFLLSASVCHTVMYLWRLATMSTLTYWFSFFSTI